MCAPHARCRVQILAPLCAILLSALAMPAGAQINDPKYADYLLVGQFGEICTMCEATVLCEAGADVPTHKAIPEQGSFKLYYLHTRSFWSQVATIREWFIANFSAKPLASGHDRPVTAYSVKNGVWAERINASAHISLEPALLVMGDGYEIDRVDRRWRKTGSHATLGYCQRLPLWESLATIKTETGATGRGSR
ncbi:MAG: hypothetical protein R3F24_07395 [Gammaproteobacteria bacterium]